MLRRSDERDRTVIKARFLVACIHLGLLKDCSETGDYSVHVDRTYDRYYVRPISI